MRLTIFVICFESRHFKKMDSILKIYRLLLAWIDSVWDGVKAGSASGLPLLTPDIVRREDKKQKAASLSSLPLLADTLPRYSPVLKVTG